MNLHRIIIHELVKVRNKQNTNLYLSDELVNNDARSEILIQALDDSYNSDSILYGVFDETDGKYFPERFQQFFLNQDEESFINFTREVVGNLETIIKSITLATGGYLVFADYESKEKNFLGIFLVRDTKGESFRKTQHSFSIESVEYVDTDNLAMACRINLDEYLRDEENYLSLTREKQQEISEYFKSWISIQQLQSSSEFTKKLYDIVSQLERPVDPQTNEEYEIEKFRDLVYSYITSRPNKNVDLHDLGGHLYDDPDIVTNYALDNNIAIDTEFRYNTRQLKKFIKIEVNKDGINFKISRGEFEEKIRFADNNRMVIIESETFADALRNEFEHLNN